MKRNLLYIASAFLLANMCLGSCVDVEYEYDVENGFDTNQGESSSVTVDTLLSIDASMYEQARIFPGLVDTLKEARIDTSLVLDLSKRFVDRKTLGFYPIYQDGGPVELLPQPIYSTGLYAGAGELVAIHIPDGNTWGLSVQIGIQTDELDAASSFLRQPVTYTRKKLFPGENRVRFPLGGYLWIIREAKVSGPQDFRLEVKGVYAAPDFVVDETHPATWAQQVTRSTVPWLELRGKRIAISVDRDRMSEYVKANPNFGTELNEALRHWDRFIEMFYNYKGFYAGHGEDARRMPDFQDRFIFDVQLADNVAMHTNNVEGVSLVKTTRFYEELLSLDRLYRADFSSISAALKDKYVVRSIPLLAWENACDHIPLYRVAEESYRKGYTEEFSDLGIDAATLFPLALQYAAADSAKLASSDNWGMSRTASTMPVQLLPLVQLAKYGVVQGEEEWAFFNQLSSDVRIDRRTGGSGVEFYFRNLCEHYGRNFTPFFEHWGVALSDELREYAAQYPLPDKEYWKINLLDKNDVFASVTDYDKTTFRHRANRSEWEAIATDSTYMENNEDDEYDSESRYQRVSNLFDGNRSSIWHSYLKPVKKNSSQKDSPYSLPYYIVIDMKEMQPMDGFYFANGGSKVLSGFTVQTTSAADISLWDDKVEWTTVKEVKQDASNALYNERFVDFDTPQSARYLRIMITEKNLKKPNEKKEADVQEFIELNKHRQQSFAEFGVYRYEK